MYRYILILDWQTDITECSAQDAVSSTLLLIYTSSALSPWGVVSSPGFGEPRSKLFLPSRTFFCFLRLLSAFPLFSRRTGLVSHFFSVFVERFGPGELWIELRDDWGCKLATDSDFPPFSPEETEYASEGNKTDDWWHCLLAFWDYPQLGCTMLLCMGICAEQNNKDVLKNKFVKCWTSQSVFFRN